MLSSAWSICPQEQNLARPSSSQAFLATLSSLAHDMQYPAFILSDAYKLAPHLLHFVIVSFVISFSTSNNIYYTQSQICDTNKFSACKKKEFRVIYDSSIPGSGISSSDGSKNFAKDCGNTSSGVAILITSNSSLSLPFPGPTTIPS